MWHRIHEEENKGFLINYMQNKENKKFTIMALNTFNMHAYSGPHI